MAFSMIHSFTFSSPTPLAKDHFRLAKHHKLHSSSLKSSHFPVTDDCRRKYEDKLKAFKYILISKSTKEDAFQGLLMVDAIQRLDVEHHFEEEIDAIILNNYNLIPSTHHDRDLYEVALRFRLLRQEGYFMPAGVFDKFKDEKGKFKHELRDDIRGLMSLHEASQLSREGEDILDEARGYSYEILNSLATCLDSPKAKAVENALKHSHLRSLQKFMGQKFIMNIVWQNGWVNELQEIATLDFKIIQHQHQQEFVHVLEWWEELGLSRVLTFARDQPAKWYVWCVAALTDPSLSQQRIDLFKPIAFVYLIDDIFDEYGTLPDLILFTEIVSRWDIAAAGQLPDCMRICFEALDNVTNEISYKVYKQHGWNPLESLRKSWASLFNAYLMEARWFASGDLPSADEYLKNGIVSSGLPMVLVHFFFLLGQGTTEKNVEFLNGNPSMITSTAKILRLWNDLGSAKDENPDGYSYVECYMKEHQISSAENARNHVLDMIAETWKKLNDECLVQNPFSPTFTKVCLNFAGIMPLMYSYDEIPHLSILEEYVNKNVRE
ncbi:(3S,6E)-nerolidol synthase 1-like isoform X1 [Mercurialis annua]|uniref:(3S,6E)-nerolidol synthase 1-like isoform X1 n=2 Tax=Mercurialis annua TaxID=3986 RepID=UPI00215F3827|nr:(3S,6E)-nerolidol synthase 1-like isoform X1 [Mercurialis annua]